MSDPFLGEIQVFGFNFAPYGWAQASGQTVSIQQYAALFSLLGVNFGGNGQSTFMLPNLASNQAVGSGTGPGLTTRDVGETFGEFNVTLLNLEIPVHTHLMQAFIPDVTDLSETPGPTNALGYCSSTSTYTTPGASVAMSPLMVQPAGGGLPHPNQQPYLGVNFCIALQGNFPQFP
jgi:microcystin-dependent protein